MLLCSCVIALASPPCDGDPPLINPNTNLDYNCGDDPTYESCPFGSYCHKSPYGTFAKCCKDGEIDEVKIKLQFLKNLFTQNNLK